MESIYFTTGSSEEDVQPWMDKTDLIFMRNGITPRKHIQKKRDVKSRLQQSTA